MRIAYVDIDGTVNDICGAIKIYLAKQGKTFFPENITQYDFVGDIGVDRDEVFKALNTKEVYEIINLYDNAIKGINLLKEECKVIAYTKTPKKFIRIREDMCRWMGFDDTFITPEEKYPHDNISVVFDDNLNVHERWLSKSDTVQYLINQPYNQEIHNDYESSLWNKVIRVENFYEGVVHYLNSIRG